MNERNPNLDLLRAAAIGLALQARRWRGRLQLLNHCHKCGYDLRGIAPGESCPECGTPFQYLTSRRIESHPSERFQIVRRLREKRPELVFIDFSDYSKTLGKKKAKDFFG